MQKKKKTLKLEQRPCVQVLACLLLVYYFCGKSKIIKLSLPENLEGGLTL